MIAPKRLDDKRRAALKILYLAPHAPSPDTPKPPAIHPDFGVQPAYQYEICDVLRNGLGLDVVSLSDLSAVPQAFEGRNYVFSLYNIAPFRNSEIYVSALAARAGIACMGAPANIRALAEDKWLTKLAAQAVGLPTPAGKPFGPGVPLQRPDFDGPYIAKPRFGAASTGIDAESAHEEFDAVAERVAALGASIDECLVEQVFGDFDVTVPILVGENGPVALPAATQTCDSPYGLFTHRQKRRLAPGLVRDFPGDEPWLPPIVEDALRFARAVGPYDYLRCDFRVGPEGHAFLEFNLACSIGSAMAFAQCAGRVGISSEALVEHILATSLDRQWGQGASEPLPT